MDRYGADMKILHAVLSDGFYGSERYCVDLAIAQARRGHDVRILVQGGHSPCARQFRDAIAEASAGGIKGTIGLAVISHAVPAWLQRPVIAAMLWRIRPDVVHSHLNPAARRVGGVAQRLGIPHVLTLHLDYDQHEHRSIDGLIALTTSQCEKIPRDFGGQVAVIWNWLASRVEAALACVGAADVRRLRESWQADDGTVVVGTVGRLMPEKGIDTLIRAFRMAFATGHEPVRLVIVGEGDQRGELQALAGNDPRIVFAGAQAEVAPYYRAFDVFVSAARFEPFGLAIIEAMGAGCRLVATRIYGTIEFVTDPRTLWVEPDNDEQLTAQLRAAVALKRERFSYDMTRLTLSRASAEIEAFYHRVAATSRR